MDGWGLMPVRTRQGGRLIVPRWPIRSAEWMEFLPEEIRSAILTEAVMWPQEAAPFPELLEQINQCFENVKALRLVGVAIARSESTLRFLYSVAYKRWSLMATVRLLGPNRRPTPMAHLAHQKDIEFFRFIEQEFSDSAAYRRALEYLKKRRPMYEKHLKSVGVLRHSPPPPEEVVS